MYMCMGDDSTCALIYLSYLFSFTLLSSYHYSFVKRTTIVMRLHARIFSFFLAISADSSKERENVNEQNKQRNEETYRYESIWHSLNYRNEKRFIE